MLREKMRFGRRYWQLKMTRQKKDVWKLKKKKIEMLKDVYIRPKEKLINSLDGR